MLYREVGQFNTSYRDDMALLPIRQDRFTFYILLAFAFAGIPALSQIGVGPFQDDYLIKAILIPWMIMSLAAIGLNILTGYCGQISLGAAAFMAVGAYSAYNFSLRIPEIPLPICILLGGAASAGVGIVFGLPSLRIKGLYLAVATLAAQFFFDWLFLRVHWFTNYTPSGVVVAPTIRIFDHRLSSSVELYLFTLTFLTVLAVIAATLVRGPIGRQWMAIRDMDIAAEMLGIKPLFAKLSAFAVSSFMIGVAGALWAFVHLGSWDPLAFLIDQSFVILFIIIIGGLGSIIGSFLGTAFILILPIVFDQLPHAVGVPLRPETVSHLVTLTIGLLIIYLLIVEPQGFARLWQIAKEKLRLWPFAYHY
jgi:branched-chain amino acid transport system permease protein